MSALSLDDISVNIVEPGVKSAFKAGSTLSILSFLSEECCLYCLRDPKCFFCYATRLSPNSKKLKTPDRDFVEIVAIFDLSNKRDSLSCLALFLESSTILCLKPFSLDHMIWRLVFFFLVDTLISHPSARTKYNNVNAIIIMLT